MVEVAVIARVGDVTDSEGQAASVAATGGSEEDDGAEEDELGLVVEGAEPLPPLLSPLTGGAASWVGIRRGALVS